MTTPRSLLTERTNRSIIGIARRGLATSLGVADPQRTLRVMRRHQETGGFPVIIVDQFHLRRADLMPRTTTGSDDGIEAGLIMGTVRRYVPPVGETRLHQGDRFELPELRATAVITEIAPDRYGVEAATWTLETGAA